MHISSEQALLCAHYHQNRRPALDFDGDKRYHHRSRFQRDFEQRLRIATGDSRWEVRTSRDGAMACGIQYVPKRFSVFWNGSPNLLDEGLVTFAQIHGYQFAQRLLDQIEAQEAAKEAEDKRQLREATEDAAGLAWDYADDARKKHFPMLSAIRTEAAKQNIFKAIAAKDKILRTTRAA